jgi:hypothetical protein
MRDHMPILPGELLRCKEPHVYVSYRGETTDPLRDRDNAGTDWTNRNETYLVVAAHRYITAKVIVLLSRNRGLIAMWQSDVRRTMEDLLR